jgi:Cof subfamily protein (haloacid dehalogenase superfamily)
MSPEPSIRLLALDVDRTLLTGAHRVLPPVREAVARIRARGVRIVLATARSPVGLRPVLAELGNVNHAICFNGGWIGRPSGDPADGLEVSSEQHLPLPVAREVVRRARADEVIPGWYAGEVWHVPMLSEAVRHEAAITGETPVVTPELEELTSPPHKILCMAAAGVGAGVAALRDLAAELRGTCTAAFSHDNFLEITPLGVDKATALAGLSRSLGIPPEATAAVGDSENDIAMIAAAGIGIAMGNAIGRVKEAAAWITGTNEDAGVALVIDRLLAAGHA